jgi:hypothetical protein
LIVCITATALAEETEIHRFSASGSQLPAGFPQNQAPKLMVIAEKSLRLHFDGHAAEWQPKVQLHRVTSTRKILLDAPDAKFTVEGWQWTWNPPATRGPANYEIRFEGEPDRVICIESRDSAWVKATLEMLVKAEWEALGISAEERVAFADHGIRLGKIAASGKGEPASLQMIPKQDGAARRRVVWDDENPELVVLRPGAATGDLEVRAPRWWISPEALATDQGLIRFLDLFSELPLNP